MADKGHQGFVNTDEERQREVVSAGGHASHERGAAHEFNNEQAAEAGRKGSHAHAMSHAAHASRADAEGGEAGDEDGNRNDNGAEGGGGIEGETEQQRTKRTRGGTHDQHVTAGKKGGSRIRQLIELGYKYEQEHGIGPGQNERSKLAAKRRTTKGGEGEGA
jgi:hypothetical protein